ncbi:hypothetical protein ACWT_4462 [Actinoplanes sp. SE50]|uniref:hypothetical protein n=1 Tax=unclassified Actinoplanes TaxID=2626549 RepID=UPI00023ECD11|nr:MULTISPECIES: hypothetical protein [unclassified Actinoplanes]AEV85484.1 hypothetical protein ACPL_4593 [Actinoplanes sp. SE50/110]ATO83877.1 hypothetical protein ACWT_4462 [Actinoplanes sp. SE50]SLM01287.1 hypothetical protein ACSP50_4523 [Actinoplanes sp. SE50/110]
MRERSKWIVVGAVLVVLGGAAAGTWRYRQHVQRQPDWQIHHTAVPDAAKKVDDVLAGFDRDHLYQAADYLHSAGRHPGVQVLSVTGQTHWQTGVTLTLRVTGHGVARGFDQVILQQRDVPICFRLTMGPKDDSRDDDIDCPTGPPLAVPRDPTLDGVDPRLQAALNPVGPDEPAVRAAVAGLKLDPGIRQDFAAHDGVVGVALRAGRYDCVVARVVARGDVTLWRPSPTQLAPGELDCSAGLAMTSGFNTSPH